MARNLPNRESWGERLLWNLLRDRRFSAHEFRQQHPFGPYVLDFFFNEAALDVEIDGFQHGRPAQLEADTKRDAWLAARGIKVHRFWSSRLRRDKEMIRDTIWRTRQERAPRAVPGYCRPHEASRADKTGT